MVAGKTSGWRANLFFFSMVVLGLAVIGRLFFLQVLKGDYYRAQALGQQKFIEETTGERGSVFFASGQVLATNEKGKFLYVSPREIKEKEKTAKIISEAIGFPERDVLERLKNDNSFELLKSRLTEEEIDAFKKTNPEGVYFDEAILRNYPQGGDMASQLIGFMNSEGTGQYGIEGRYDAILKGKEELRDNFKTPWGYLTSLINEGQAEGEDIWLTVDYQIQFTAEKLLLSVKENLDIEGGQIIVMEPSSGRILALANFPNFDPNRYKDYANKENLEIFQNSTIQKIFEPGSVFKPITIAAALEEGKVTPETTFVDDGYVQIGGRTIYNFGRQKWGQKTMTEVLEKSINTGAVFAEKQVGSEQFLKYIEAFGFFEKTGIDLDGEIFSDNRVLKQGKEINLATASFGQGIEITPLQLVRAFSAIANEGKLARPYIVEKIGESDIIDKKRELISGIISAKTASQITAMLVNVVENGYGKKAKIPGYYVAGKTGTAQVPSKDRRGYYSDKTVQSFIGFAPAFDPKFLILVKLDNPQSKTAEYSAAPIFRDLAKYIIDYRQIPPDYE